MTIRTRLTLWYAGILIASLAIVSYGTYRELIEQLDKDHEARPVEYALEETGELVVQVALPAVVIGLLGGWWLTRRALTPVSRLTEAAQHINEHNLGTELPRSHNGDELDRLAEVLNDMTRRLNGSFARIHEFTLHASHELKTPLTIMCGETEMELQDESLTQTKRDRIASQLEELRRLGKIVDGLTLLAKAEAGLIRLASDIVPLDELVQECFADIQILAVPTKIRVKLETCEHLDIRGDRHRLRQLLLNLADNAVKYNHPEGRITLNLHRAGANGARLVIANTGPGISGEALPRVFDRFFRGDPSHNHEIEGSGLGLSIAQWIVRSHDGTIKIESAPAQLTVVTVDLPLAGANGGSG
jgi:signal transduction histidine kinase